MTSTTLWTEFESLWVQLNAPGAENVGPKVLDAVRKLRRRHDSDQELHQQQQLKLDEKRKQALILQQERLELGSSKLQVELQKGRARLADLKEKLVHKEDEARACEDRAQSVRIELREARAEVANLQNRLKVVDDEAKYLKSRHADQWSKLANEREGIDSDLNDRARALSHERALAEQGRNALEQRDSEIDAFKQELSAQEAELQKLSRARQAAVDGKNQSGQNAEAKARISVVREQLKEVQAASEALYTGVEQRRVSLSLTQARRKQLEETQTAAVTGLSQAAMNVQVSSQAKEELVRLGDVLSLTRSTLIQQKSTVTTEAKQLSDLQAEQARKLGELQATVKFLEADCESAKEAVMLQEIKRTSKPIVSTDLSKIAEEERVASERISMLEDQTLEIKKQIPGLQAQLNSTQEILQNRLSKVAGLKFRASDAEENLATIRSQIARAKEQGIRLQKRFELQESTTLEKEAITASRQAELATASSMQQQHQKEAMLQSTLNSLADRARGVSDNVTDSNRTLAQLRQKDKGWVSEPRRMYAPSNPSRAPQESIPECISDCPPEDYRPAKPTPPTAGPQGGGLMSRIDALAMSVTSIAAENDQLEQRIRSPSPCSSAMHGRDHSRTLPKQALGTLSTTPPSTEGGYKDSMSSPRNGGREYDQERFQYQTSGRRLASPSGRQRSPSPGLGGGGYRSHAFEQQHTIPELSHGVYSEALPRGRK